MSAELRGQIELKKLKKMEFATKAGGRIATIKKLLAASALTPLEQLDLDTVADLACEAAELRREYLELRRQIEAAEAEL